MAAPQQEALALELKKRYTEAADQWLIAGQVEKAIFNYQRGGNLKRAIDLALDRGLNRKAAELLVKAELHDKAAELYRRERDFSSAARTYRQGGRIAEAAAMFEAASEFSEAARLHESVNDFLKAGELYEKGGDLQSSARVYELAIDANALGRLGGKRDMARVAEVLTRVKNFEKAAEIYIQSQEVCEAVLMFVKLGEVDGAARLLANCQADVGFEVLTRIDYADPSAVDFARMFYVARDFQKAGRVFEACGQPGKAAFLFEKCQDYARAAEMYAAANDAGKAAQMFEKAGAYADAADSYLRAMEPARAAACFEAAQDFYQAGKLYFDVERYDKAMDLLQKVDPASSRYVDASLIVGELMRKKGYLDLAIDHYRTAISGLACTAPNLDHFYSLAVILMEKREWAEAEALLGRIVRVSFAFRDAAQLLEETRRRLREPAPTVPGPVAVTEPRAPTVAAATDAALPTPSGRSFVVGRMEGFEVLAATALFAEISLAEMRRFWEIAEVRRVAAGEVVVAEGETGRGLFVIKDGSVDVVKAGEILVRLHAGEFFGEMSLVDAGALTSAGCVAAVDSELFFLARGAFQELLAASDNTALKMYRVFVATLCARLRRATQDLAAVRGAG